MKIIGLCGGSGAGKGEVCRLFLKYGIPSVDTDAVSKIVMKKGNACYDEVVAAFGKDILDANGEILRKRLATRIFQNCEEKKRLEDITHRYIIEYSLEEFSKFEDDGYEFAIADAPLLFESGMNKICYKNIAVISDEGNRINRIMSRDNITYEIAFMRINSQLSHEELKKRCDYIIYNDATFEELDLKVRKITDEIKK